MSAARSRRGRKRGGETRQRRVRYAVVGLGWIAQSAFLPAFRAARKNSELVALVSDDKAKLRTLGRRYGVEQLYGYDDYERCLSEADVDAVVIALPNSQHRAYSEAAAKAGVHVLCEKPMALTEEDCESMIRACRDADVKLMVGYRLHFEKANLDALALVKSGKLGTPRLFSSVFTNDVEAGNLRLKKGEGGPLYDIGIYCVNAARALFQAEPEEVMGWHASGDDPRFRECPELTVASLRFPGERLATLSCSFGGGDVSAYDVVGSKGSLHAEPAYEISAELEHRITIGDHERTKRYAKRDQFAPELLYFSDCIVRDREPEPSGEEGLADVRVLRAIERSASERRPITLSPYLRAQRPTPAQEIHRPPHKKVELVRVQEPTA